MNLKYCYERHIKKKTKYVKYKTLTKINAFHIQSESSSIDTTGSQTIRHLLCRLKTFHYKRSRIDREHFLSFHLRTIHIHRVLNIPRTNSCKLSLFRKRRNFKRFRLDFEAVQILIYSSRAYRNTTFR